MEKITVPYKGKTHQFNCYATQLHGAIVFCFATPDLKPHPVLKNDSFFVMVNPVQPDQLATNGYDDTKEGRGLVEAAADVVIKRFVQIKVNPGYHN